MAAGLAGLLARAEHRAAPPLDYAVAGQRLRVHYADEALREVLAPALGHLREPVSGHAGLRLFVLVGAPGASAPALAPDARRPRVHFAEGALRGVLYPATGISGLLDGASRRAAWWVPAPERVPLAERSGPFRTVLGWWLAGHGLSIAHAAAVGTAGGAALLVGRGGSGKSVTAVACAAAGLGFLGDDTVVCASDPVPTAHCLYGHASLHAEDARRFPGLAVSWSGEDKVLVDLGARAVRALPLQAVLVPRVTGQPRSRVSPISGAAVLRALAPSSLLNVPGSGAPAFGQLAALARGLPGYRLDLGTDLEDVARVVASVLGGPRP